jgi:hypothetical protein
MGRKRIYIGFWLDSQNERYHYEALEIVGRTILKLIFEKEDRVVWAGFIWLRIWTSGGLL